MDEKFNTGHLRVCVQCYLFIYFFTILVRFRQKVLKTNFSLVLYDTVIVPTSG